MKNMRCLIRTGKLGVCQGTTSSDFSTPWDQTEKGGKVICAHMMGHILIRSRYSLPKAEWSVTQINAGVQNKQSTQQAYLTPKYTFDSKKEE